MENKFNEEDKKKITEYLNFIVKNAKFNNLSVQEMAEGTRLYTYMVKTILPKIEENILEVIAIHEAKKEGSEEK